MWLAILIFTAGIPHAVSDAVSTFNQGYLFFRETGMESEEPDAPGDSITGIDIFTDGCEPMGTDMDLALWNFTMQKLWERVNKAETSFTVTAGDEFLYYENFLLFFADQDERRSIAVHPEELWSILHHAESCSLPALGQIMVEAYYPGMDAPATVFITTGDPAMRTVQTLLRRGRDSAASTEN
ncbi:MAG: hypothetical protein U9P42_01745 [Candidatus Fermentibacteria bacterium]|nr:hypothetical protein [Candidatus Fermentibacteria bacterium]